MQQNEFTNRFYGRIKLKHAAAVFWYSKGDIVQQMIFKLKYKKEKQLGAALGKILAQKIHNNLMFGNLDIIIPVPIHPVKKRKRGYNQSYLIAIEISELLNLSIDDKSLFKKSHTESQTHKSRVNRLLDMADSFGIIPTDVLKGKNVLLVDDVLTTGATLEACAKLLETAEVNSISMVSIAMGRL